MQESDEGSAAKENNPTEPTKDMPVPTKRRIEIVDVTHRGLTMAIIGGVRAPKTKEVDTKAE